MSETIVVVETTVEVVEVVSSAVQVVEVATAGPTGPPGVDGTDGATGPRGPAGNGGDFVSNGSVNVPRQIAMANVTQNTGQLRLTYFRQSELESVVRAGLVAASVNAPVGVTLAKIGIYEVALPSGDLTLIAATANTTSLVSGANVHNTALLLAGIMLQPDTMYATGTLTVQSGTAPTVAGSALGTNSTGLNAIQPPVAQVINGQTDLPDSILGSATLNSGNQVLVSMLSV